MTLFDDKAYTRYHQSSRHIPYYVLINAINGLCGHGRKVKDLHMPSVYSTIVSSARDGSFLQSHITPMLEATRDDPHALVFAAEAADIFVDSDASGGRYTRALAGLFGEAFTTVATHVAWGEASPLGEVTWGIPEKGRTILYRWLSQQEDLDLDDLHTHVLLNERTRMRDIAVTALITRPERALPIAATLLEEKKADRRLTGVELLIGIAAAEALPLIEGALKGERSKKVRQKLSEAREVSDPELSPDAEANALVIGTYRFDDPFSINDGLAELRSIDLTEPSSPLWVRLCNLLDRIEDAGGLQIALDYLKGHGVRGLFRDELRRRPFGWEHDPDRCDLTWTSPHLAPWTTVHRFASDNGAALLAAYLKQTEHRVRQRKLDVDQIPTFIDWIERAWDFCLAHDLPPHLAEVRLDGGAVDRVTGGVAGNTTTLELTDGFGVTLTRGRTFAHSHSGEAGMRFVRIQIPSRHSARQRLGLQSSQRYHYLRKPPRWTR